MKGKKALKELRRRYIKKQAQQLVTTRHEDLSPVITTWTSALRILDDFVKELEDKKSENENDKEL